MGTYNMILTTKSRKLKANDGTKVEVHLMRYMGKQSFWDKPKPWETALMNRLSDIWACRDYPQYVTNEELGENYAVYERVEDFSFTDEYPSSRIFTGYIRHNEQGRPTVEKWGRLIVPVETNRPTDAALSPSRVIQDLLSASGLMGGKYYVRPFNDAKQAYVLIHTMDDADLTRARLVLAGDYQFVDKIEPSRLAH